MLQLNKYRSDIDGLRAIAIISVLLYHAEFSFFSGGFVGVDIFFVISGYLITQLILRDVEQDQFSFLHFCPPLIFKYYFYIKLVKKKNPPKRILIT